LFLLIPVVVAFVVRSWPGRRPAVLSNANPRPFVDLINGDDGEWSTSKASVLFWTIALAFAFLAILFHTAGKGLEDAVLKAEYFVVLGIPAAAAIAAKGITLNKIENGNSDKTEEAPNTNVLTGVGQLVSSNGKTDLLDFQYFIFNLILLGFFLLSFFDDPGEFPDLPDTLLALSGVAAASYVGKKGLSDDAGPVIRSIAPKKVRIGQTITIYGANFATRLEPTVQVTIDGVPAQHKRPVLRVSRAEIEADVPQGVTPGENVEVVVVAYDGRTATSTGLEILA
jgi:hypothetical protein